MRDQVSLCDHCFKYTHVYVSITHVSYSLSHAHFSHRRFVLSSICSLPLLLSTVGASRQFQPITELAAPLSRSCSHTHSLLTPLLHCVRMCVSLCVCTNSVHMKHQHRQISRFLISSFVCTLDCFPLFPLLILIFLFCTFVSSTINTLLSTVQ